MYNNKNMEMSKRTPSSAMAIFLVFALFIQHFSAVQSIGVNYGTVADNLPPPAQVVQFIKDKTFIDRVKIFDVNPDIIRAFANTGILLTVTVPNGEIPNLTNIRYARRWVNEHIKPFYPQTKINYIAVGNEVLHWGPQNLIDNLVAAMRTLHQALVKNGITDIKVTSPHSLGILESAKPPSLAKFRPGWDVGVLAPMLQFLRETKSPFMVNPYPYFGFDPKEIDFDLFRPNRGYYDRFSKRSYANQFDLLLDAVFMSMKRLGYADVDIVAAETGWPSQGETFEPQCTPANAAAYNGGLVKKYNSGTGTPLMPHRKIETYIFALFNENQKPGSLAERSWGLFRPDFTPVYDVGIMRGGQSSQPVPVPAAPALQGKKWCVPKAGATDAALQSNIDYVCSQGLDCSPIQAEGACFNPNNVRSHAGFVMNSWYQSKGKADYNCDFSQTGFLTSTNPSYGTCQYTS
ncbi:glucan endo-1,3-beta-glucosidase-like [Coffea eugenioides]|uniref:glucan endo-1,3-beta-glucosidase-like n=1 Tax=Coffea eugenioides TaxID=49369 RepID=UPI000F605320|nr:glucan endo-1,3-beta-glucosidase-like [Coffea eugenioides]XP_027160534.1 glucan endo-1,3-beta-glucosidase-like [Coffea eugenioides]